MERVVFSKRPSGELLVTQVENEVLIYDTKNDQAHVLQPLHAEVLEQTGVAPSSTLASRLFPEMSAPDAMAQFESVQFALWEKKLLTCDAPTKMDRRDFGRKVASALAVPAIFSLTAPLPAAADSLASYTFDGAGFYTGIAVPTNATTVEYAAMGSDGGGGAGGGKASNNTTGGMGADGAAGGTTSGTIDLMGATTVEITIGGVGMGGTRGMMGNSGGGGMPGSGGAAGAGGTDSGGDNDAEGDDGSAGSTGDSMTGGGGGGGGGGQGGNVVLELVGGSTFTIADGGRGGGGGGGGGTSGMGMSGSGQSGGAGGNPNGGDGGDGASGSNSGTGGAGGGRQQDGSDGDDEGSVTITFCA
jgi:hypothetical protein